MEYLESLNRDNNFTDDIKPRVGSGFDPRDLRVRRQSIGWLDETYFSRRSILQPKYFSDSAYTRIPPLDTMPSIFYNSSLRQATTKKATQLFAFIGLGLASAYAWIKLKAIDTKELAWEYMPKSYSVSRGAYIDWALVRLRFMRIVAPLVLLVLMVVLIADYNSPTSFKVKSSPNVYSSHNSSGSANSSSPNTGSQANSSNSSSSGANSTSGSVTNGTSGSGNSSYSSSYSSDPDDDTNSLQAAANNSSPSSSSSSSSPRSSGSSSTPSSSSSSSSSSGTSNSSGSSSSGSSILPTTTVTLPTVNTSLGSQPLINTSSTSLTL